jgi:hypothetical protein
MNTELTLCLIPFGPADDFLTLTKLMASELEGAGSVFAPSRFWQYLNNLNLDQLSRGGLGNFKRTVNQNYFNWVPTNRDDNQFRRLFLGAKSREDSNGNDLHRGA